MPTAMGLCQLTEPGRLKRQSRMLVADQQVSGIARKRGNERLGICQPLVCGGQWSLMVQSVYTRRDTGGEDKETVLCCTR